MFLLLKARTIVRSGFCCFQFTSSFKASSRKVLREASGENDSKFTEVRSILGVEVKVKNLCIEVKSKPEPVEKAAKFLLKFLEHARCNKRDLLCKINSIFFSVSLPVKKRS